MSLNYRSKFRVSGANAAIRYVRTKCPLCPPTGHIVNGNAAIRTNGRNAEAGLPQMMVGECPHWADHALWQAAGSIRGAVTGRASQTA
nr:hypothetical protein [uncultured Cohaesibacter sp.]